MKSLDCGTMHQIKGEIDPVVNSPAFTVERNVFLKAATTEDTEVTLKENNWSYAKHNDDYYILGEDAIKLKTVLTINSKDESIVMTKTGELRRPMKDGILNTGEEKLAIAMIQTIIKKLLGKPNFPGEHLCFCAPGDPVNADSSVLFHKTMLTNFLKSLGYTVECITEALAIIFSERPVAEDPSESDGLSPYTGIGISWGAGMTNVVFALKKIPLINFSIVGGGDKIDEEAAKVAGIDVSAITRYKERHLNLDKIDYSDIRQAALDIFYQNIIENSLNIFAEKFSQLENPVDFPLSIVVAGGTASVPGFIGKFKTVLSGLSLPFKVKEVILAENPLFCVANGCLLKAMASEKRAAG